MEREPKLTDASKHIEIHYHYIRTIFEDRAITVKYVPSDDNTSDVLTKRLARILQKNHRARMEMKEHGVQAEEEC